MNHWTESDYQAHMAKFKVKPKERQISEKVFQEEVRKIALIHGWRYYHPWISIKSTGGYPDVTMVHPGKRRLIFAELKADGKKLRQDQQDWIDDLNAARWVGTVDKGKYHLFYEVYVWHPSDIDEIWEILRR